MYKVQVDVKHKKKWKVLSLKVIVVYLLQRDVSMIYKVIYYSIGGDDSYDDNDYDEDDDDDDDNDDILYQNPK